MKTLTTWAIAIAITVAVGALAAHHSAEADREDTEALHSRDFAGQAVCGPHATPEWLDDKTLQCLRHIDAPTIADPNAPHAPHAPTVLAEATK